MPQSDLENQISSVKLDTCLAKHMNGHFDYTGTQNFMCTSSKRTLICGELLIFY